MNEPLPYQSHSSAIADLIEAGLPSGNEPIDIGELLFQWAWRSEYDQRFDLLCDHYEISRDDPDRWRKLSLALAKDYVPGFREKAPLRRGRSRQWSEIEELQIWQRFTRLLASGKSERSAAAIIARTLNRTFKLSRPQQLTGAAMLSRLKQIKLRIIAGGLIPDER